MFFFVLAGMSLPVSAQAQTLHGFDLSRASIDSQLILSGGPPRDGIPSIDHPKFIPAKRVTYLGDDDIVIGLVRGNQARAYPLRILIWHEVVNDVINHHPVAITYCPLCGTAIVFDRRIDGKTLTFGVSGLLYQSDALLYDRESESLWSQLAMKAISGSAVGKKLTWLISEHSTWKAWRKKYPDGEVLSIDTGFYRNYGGHAYASYFASDDTMFPVPHKRRELPNKAWVIGMIIEGHPKAYPVDELPRAQVLQDRVENKKIMVRYDADAQRPQITDSKGEEIPYVVAFWFAWQAFYPDTEVYYNHPLKK